MKKISCRDKQQNMNESTNSKGWCRSNMYWRYGFVVLCVVKWAKHNTFNWFGEVMTMQDGNRGETINLDRLIGFGNKWETRGYSVREGNV